MKNLISYFSLITSLTCFSFCIGQLSATTTTYVTSPTDTGSVDSPLPTCTSCSSTGCTLSDAMNVMNSNGGGTVNFCIPSPYIVF